MKSSEFLREGDDRNINDVQVNHPDIYKFMVGVVGSMALNKQSYVSNYNTAKGHHVIIRIQPSAGLQNTSRGLSGEGHRHEMMDDMIQGSTDTFRYRISDDKGRGERGNIEEKWEFIVPQDNE